MISIHDRNGNAVQYEPIHENGQLLLNFGHALLGTEGVRDIAQFLKSDHTVTEINLWENNLSVAGVRTIGNALEVNQTVQQIDLWKNNLGDEGAKVIAKVLEVNCTLNQIDLSDNAISIVGARALADAMKANRVVTRMNLSRNNLGGEGAQILREIDGYLKRNIKISKRALKQSQRVAALLLFLRANSTHEYRYSILPLIDHSIGAFLGWNKSVVQRFAQLSVK